MNSPAHRKTAIQYWERSRIVYNLALTPPALFGYILAAGISAGVGDPRQLSSREVVLLFVLGAIGANICFTFAYALEFLFGNEAADSRWARFWRPLLVVVGTLFAMALSLVGGRNIALIEYSPVRILPF